MAFFPLFLAMDDLPVLVVGGGLIATRRILTLAEFGVRVSVVASDLTPEIRYMAERGTVAWRQAEYCRQDMKDMRLAIAATNDRDVNRQVGEDAKALAIPVSVADAREECTFYFPALAIAGGVTAGLISPAGNHRHVAKAAAIIRNELERLDADDSSRCEG